MITTGRNGRTLPEVIAVTIPDQYLDRIRLVAADSPGTAFSPDDFMGFVAAEANHAKSRKRQKALDVVFEKMQRLLESAAEG
jgi:hypothetical protein